MEFKALVLYMDAYALYLITREDEGIYTAVLKRYDGNNDLLPPSCVTLTKSFRSWKGSTDLQTLVDELGEIIEMHLQVSVSIQSK